IFFFSSRRRHTRSYGDWSSDVCSSDLGDLSGTYGSATTAAEELGGDKVRTIDTGTASAAVAMLGLAIQRRLDRGTTDEELAELRSEERRVGEEVRCNGTGAP